MQPVNGYERGSLSVVAGHLYGLQSKLLPCEPQDDTAVLAAFVDALKAKVVEGPSVDFFVEAKQALAKIFKDEGSTIRDFWTKRVEDAKNPELKAASERSIGQLLFLLNHDIDQTEKLLKEENPQNALTAACTAILKHAKAQFDAHITEVKKYGVVKETNDLIENLMPMAIAKQLISEEGFFNVAIIDDVKNVFFSKVENASQQAMAQVLANISASSECQNILNSLKAPKEDTYSWNAIVDMLGVENVSVPVEPPQAEEPEESESNSEPVASESVAASASQSEASEVEQEQEEVAALVVPELIIRITDADARKCALAAYLAKAGAASFSQALKAANLPRFMSDVNQLIEQGCLTRKVQGYDKLIEFALDGKSSALLSKISVSSNGSITDGWGAYLTKPLSLVRLAVENDKLWQMHGIIAACKAMDIANVETATKEALESLGFKVSSLLDKDSKRRYEAVPQDIIYAIAGDDEAKAIQGCIAFTSTYDNTIHCALQNAYEDMRTLRARSSHLARVHSAVREVLFEKFVSKDLHEQVALRAVFAEFLDNLQSDLEASKATNAKSFQELVIKALPASVKEPAQVTAVKALVHTDAFTEAVGQKFDANHFPWNVVPVGTAADFVKVYDDSKVLPFEPKSALGLFGVLVNKLKTVQPGNVVYLTSPQHALEFIGNPKAFEDTPKASWDASIKQAKAIMEQEVKKVEVRTSFIKAMGALIGDFYLDIPKEIGKKPTFEEFRSKLLPNELAAILEDVSTEPYHAELDNLFTNFLYEKQKDLFIPFAKTTTPVDGQVIEFSFFADPITSKVAVVMIRDNKVTRVDQKEWLEGNWQFGQIQVPATV